MKYLFRPRGADLGRGRKAREDSVYHYTDNGIESRCGKVRVNEQGYILQEINQIWNSLVCYNCKLA